MLIIVSASVAHHADYWLKKTSTLLLKPEQMKEKFKKALILFAKPAVFHQSELPQQVSQWLEDKSTLQRKTLD